MKNCSLIQEVASIFDIKQKNLDIAIPLYELQIQLFPKNSDISLYNLAHIYRFSDPEKAKTLLLRIKNKDADAIWLLANICIEQKNMDEGLKWIQEGVDKGDNACLHNMANIYYYGYHETPIDYDKAFEYYERSATNGYIPSIIAVVRYYCNGIGSIKKNCVKETEWIEKIPFEKLTPINKFNLAFEYIKGRCGVDKVQKGYDIMMELVNEHDDADAMYMLGEYYALRKGSKSKESIEWYKKGAEHGDYDSCIKLMSLTTSDEHYYYLKKAFTIRNTWKYEGECDASDNRSGGGGDISVNNLMSNVYPKTKLLNVEAGALCKLFEELLEAQKKVEEYEMRPPLIGGKLFREAMARFNHVEK